LACGNNIPNSLNCIFDVKVWLCEMPWFRYWGSWFPFCNRNELQIRSAQLDCSSRVSIYRGSLLVYTPLQAILGVENGNNYRN